MSDVQTETTAELGTQTETEITQQTETTQTEQPQQPDTSWVPKRISEITAARRAAERRAEEAEARAREQEAELARLRAAQGAPAADGAPPVAKPTPQMSQEDFDKLVNARAAAVAKQNSERESMNSRINAINEAGKTEFGADFDKAADTLNGMGVVTPDFLRVLTNIDNAAKVVAFLGKPENLNEAMRVASLDPVQMGIEMVKLSEKATKAFAKQVSKAPAPIESVSGRSASSDGVEPDPSDHKAWIAWRAKNKKTRR